MEAGQGLWSKSAIDYGTVKHSMLSLVSLTFDDGFRCQFDQALPVLKRHGIPATFFLIANQEPTHEGRKNEWWKIDWRDEDLAMLKKAVQEGHEIGSHSVTHDETKMPKQPEFEARESKRRIESWMGTEISSFCYPYYHSHLYLGDAVRNAGYQQARMGAQNSYYALSAPLDFNLDCRQVSKHDDVKEWIRPDHWHVLTFHGIGDEHSGWEPIPVDRFVAMATELVKYRDSKRLELVTFKAGAERFRQPPAQSSASLEKD